jgi:phenylpropionate dioxygenase-like ring-hydroxylating dioxygenase large terminal subunit
MKELIVNQQAVQSSPFDDNAAIADLVRGTHVHSKVYTDQRIFELELERIFSTTWVYIGHESEIPSPGDYQTRSIASTPVLLVRGVDQNVRVLINRCRHRGAQVCETNSGNTKLFRCWYHGWVYDTTGALIEVSDMEGYGNRLDTSTMGLTPVPRVDSYRGFFFASLAPQGESLKDHLGSATDMIDLLVDASPTGKILVDGGTNRTEYRGNWKLVGMDGYHTPFVHASVFASRQRGAAGSVAVEVLNRSHSAADDGIGARDLGHGHAMLDYRNVGADDYDKRCADLKNVPGGPEYIAAMHKAHEDQRARQLIGLGGDPHLGVFPNMQIVQNHVRIITPLGPDHTQITMFVIRLGDVSDEINARRLRRHEYFFGPAGAGSPDDAEIFERAQRGMMGEVDPWLEISRGIEREVADDDGVVAWHTDEVPQRGMMKHWVKLMTQTK